MFLTADTLEKGSTIKFETDSNGSNFSMLAAVLPSGKRLKLKYPLMMFSMMYQTNRNPIAKAERFTKTPKNKQNEKNPTSLTKKAKRYSKSEKTVFISA